MAENLIKESEVQESIQRIEYDQPEHSTDKLNGYVYGSNSLSISVNTDG